MGDTIAISPLAVKVYTAYKDAPGDYRHMLGEVKSLQIITSKAARHFEGTTLRNNSWQEGQRVLKGCQNVLGDLNSLQIAPLQANLSGVKFGKEGIATLRARLISNTGLLNGFIQRFDIPVITIEYTMLMSF